MSSRTLSHRDYSVGWVCALPKELAAATVMLDKRHLELPQPPTDPNIYTLGSIGDHNIAIVCLPKGDIGNNPAATVATRMTTTFPSIKFWLMVGIGGGVPPKVRLGDVVVSTPVYEYSGVVQWDLGMAQDESFRRIGSLNKPPEVLLSAVTKLEAHHEIYGADTGILSLLEELQSNNQRFASSYLRSENLQDNLFRADYSHVRDSKKVDDNDDDVNKGVEVEVEVEVEEEGEEEDGKEDCRYCDRTKTIRRSLRKMRTKIHYGVVASGNSVIKDAKQRDEINIQRTGGNALCFEMEAAGIANNHPCLVIRGICDYCDTHKNYSWQRYAATVAAAFAKELLGFVTPSQVDDMPPAIELLNEEIKDVKHKTELVLHTVQNIDTTFALSRLPSVNEAAYNSLSNQSEPLCHSETRIGVLQDIKDWALDSQSKCMFWLNGMAGTGKSTISRTIARDFAHSGHLGASFFFKRGEGDRGDASKFFTTIASQLGQHIPVLRPRLKKVVEVDPIISTKTMKEQFQGLILQPMSGIKELLQTQLLLVIDALDECENDDHIRILLYLLAQIQLIKSLKMRILITSRPELIPRMEFKRIPNAHQDLILHEIPKPIITLDISIFLRSEFTRIRDDYNLLSPSDQILPSDWPSKWKMEVLITMAVPLFIFAATMSRFIGETDWDWDPVKKLAQVLDYQSKGSLTQLEKTYLPVLNQILKGNIEESEKKRRIQQFRDIVGPIIILFEPLSTTSLGVLLGMPTEVIDRRLHILHSVLRVPDNRKSPVRLFHLSFRDFLVDVHRKSSQFWIDEEDTHRKIASKCLELVSKTRYLKKDICSLKKLGSLRTDISETLIEKCLPAEVQYACRYWVHHLEQGKCLALTQDLVYGFLNQRFLYWIEALSIIGRVNEGLSMIANLQRLLKVNDSSTLGAFLNDAKRFILMFREILNIAPLQIYCSAIVFAPEKSIIRETFEKCIPPWMQVKSKVQIHWNALLQTLEGHSGSVSSVAFSLDSKLLPLLQIIGKLVQLVEIEVL
ncbi:Vegetative incompatibility protein HET-E-1 [Lachnellula arida]|uniref:Vegetative incompatibility protein HET-E-1 n=1 Tax=Lachnellula arida TaxID=1316785 RepID=A0A8T9B5V5_9HELO|nr:Vegetative incompatibility protein HET-E-1 [Lachnellula arida]